MELTWETEHAAAAPPWVEELYELYAPRCQRAALAILRDERLAEEAVQETWVKALTLAHSAAQEDVERQLFTILKHTALDILKKENRYVPLPDTWDAPCQEDGDSRARFDRTVQLIRALPEKYRLVLELRFLGGCSCQEIAQRLGLGESTVSTRIQRGREQLKRALRKEGLWE